MEIMKLVEEIKKNGIQRTVEEGREDLGIMGIDPQDFVIPEGTSSIYTLVPQCYDEEGFPDNDVEEEAGRSFGFDYNRDAYIWEDENGVLMFVTSDGYYWFERG